MASGLILVDIQNERFQGWWVRNSDVTSEWQRFAPLGSSRIDLLALYDQA